MRTTDEWAVQRLLLVGRFEEVVGDLDKPMSAFELAGAVGRDARNDRDAEAAVYDRRGLLNVVAVLVDVLTQQEEQIEALDWRARLKRLFGFGILAAALLAMGPGR